MPSIHAADLEVDYEDAGPPDAPALLLLHGWPDIAPAGLRSRRR